MIKKYSYLIYIYLLVFISSIYCDGGSSNGNDDTSSKTYQIQISNDALKIVYFVLLLLFGLLNIFLGTKLFRFANFTSGFILLFLISYFIMNIFELGSNQYLAFFIACNVLGCIGGAVCAFIPYFGTFLGGFIMGGSILNLILCGANLKILWLGWCLIVLIGLITGFLTVKYQKWLFPLSSSINGSQLLILGIDLLLNPGVLIFIKQFSSQKFGTLTVNPALVGLLTSIIPISLVGFLFQLKFFKLNVGSADADVSILKRKRRLTLPSSPLPLTPLQRMTSASSTKPIIDRTPKPIGV
jgi:hypothetical protein